MKKNLKTKLLLAAICIAGFTPCLYAQSTYKISASKENDMKLSGTSTFHKWSMDARVFSGDAQFSFKTGNDNQLATLKSLAFKLAVLNLKSGEKGLDKNAYKALKTDKYENILYTLTSATIMPEKDGKYLVRTQGNLVIAGVTKTISMDVYCVVNKDASITCTGSYKLKMADYSVKPPSFMLGSMKTGNEISLGFTLVYIKKAIA